MTEDVHVEDQTLLPKKKKTKMEKQAEHIVRIKKTLVACIAGILAGILSYYLQVTVKTDIGLLAFMLMLAVWCSSGISSSSCRSIPQNWEQKTGSTRDS